METLSSCYFCGAALDEPLEEYPVVPHEFREGEPTTTATLCPGCHRKLETIFEEVLPAASEATLTDSVPASRTPEGDESPAEAEPDQQPEERSASADFEDSTMGLADADDVLTDPEQPSTGGEEATEIPDVPDLEETPYEREESSSGRETQETAGDSRETDTDDEGAEPAVDGDAGDDEEGGSTVGEDEAGDDDEISAEDIEGMAGDLDPSIVEDDESEPAEDDELEDAMEPDVPAAFQSGDDADAEVENEADASSEGDSAGDVDREEQVAAGGEAEEDEQSETGEETVEDAMEPDVTAEFQFGSGEKSAAESEFSESTEPESEEEPEVESETMGETDAETATEGEASVSRSVTALEYNKVMRLLQNREFPVDREEIETVAASAYELAQSECAEVIDLAVDRELIDEEDGKLLRP